MFDNSGNIYCQFQIIYQLNNIYLFYFTFFQLINQYETNNYKFDLKKLKNSDKLNRKDKKMHESDIKKPTTSKPIRQKTFNETFDSSIADKHQRFMLDKTLVQGIKLNDCSKIVENSEERDLGDADQLYDEQKEVHEMFVGTRKDFDKTKQIVNKIQLNLERLRKEKQMLLAERAKIEANFSEQREEFKKTQEELQKWNAICENADYEKDIRIQMSQVLKHDILFYKKHCFEANGKILRNNNKLRSLNGQFQSTRRVSSNCKSLIYSIQKKITKKESQRFGKISSYHDIINKKMENNMKREERERMIEESMLEALNGKMPEEQEQKKLLLANLVLKRMLKLKMEREMEKFNTIESTFRKIKQHTTVKRADEFVDKFIKREKNYGELLQGISKNEDKINLLKQQNEKLQKQNNELMAVKQAIEDKENEKKFQANREINLSIDILREKLLHNEFLKNKTLSFVSKFIAGFDKKNLEDIKPTLSRQKPNYSLREALQRVNKFLNNLKEEEEQIKLKQIYVESKNLALPESIKTKNIRIRTLAEGQENQNSAMDNYDAVYDDVSEKQFLNQNRKQIKKSLYLRNRIKTRAY